MKNVEDIYVVSPLQQGLIFESLYSPGSGAYFVQVIGRMKGHLDHDALRRAWERVVERHTILRTCFLWEDVDEVLQVVRRAVKLPWEEFDWRGLSAGEQEAQLETFLKEDRARGFDLTRAPLMRVALIRLADRAYKFIWSHHHVLVDGWSGFLVFKEVFDLYAAFSAGREHPLPPPRPFRDYIAWLQQQDLAEAERFWRERLKGFTNSTPLTRDRRASNGNGGSWKPDLQMLSLSEETTAALKQLARRHELTLNTLVQGAWALVFGCYSRERDLVFGTVVSGRPADLSGVESMVGLFINLLPLRVHLDGDAALLDWLKGMQSDQAEARVYEYSPLMQVQGWGEVPRGVPLFESIMAFENYPAAASLSAQEEEGLQVTELSSIENANYPLGFNVAPGAEMLLQLSYDHALFDAETAARMLGHVQNVLTSFVANPRRRLKEISLLSEAERRTLLVEWNQTKTEYPNETCIHHLFEAQAERTPERIALTFEGTQLTYRELNARANQLARHLQTLGVGPEVLVGLCLERSPEMVVGLLAVLKAGGAYVPLDPSYPLERLAFIIEDAGATVMLIEERVAESIPATWAQTVYIDSDWEQIAQQSDQNPRGGAGPENVAYVIYTSGSTGKPKGAVLQHRGVCNLLTAEVCAFELGADARVLQFASLSFDASVFEMLMALFTGATLCLASKESIIPGAPLLETLRRERITHLVIPPSILGALPDEELPGLETIVVVGEACSAEVARRWAPGRNFFNAYGPTEISVCATIARYEVGDRRPPIGRPIINTRVYVLDEEMRPVAVGVAGELYVGGEGLGRGYLRR
ncbi:MAG: hypothetical protein QOH49_2460, partial [Acidobacteriota bacterium]|nr:hypothetical protein [Acidobacteriota bacterium]